MTGPLAILGGNSKRRGIILFISLGLFVLTAILIGVFISKGKTKPNSDEDTRVNEAVTTTKHITVDKDTLLVQQPLEICRNIPVIVEGQILYSIEITPQFFNSKRPIEDLYKLEMLKKNNITGVIIRDTKSLLHMNTDRHKELKERAKEYAIPLFYINTFGDDSNWAETVAGYHGIGIDESTSEAGISRALRVSPLNPCVGTKKLTFGFGSPSVFSDKAKEHIIQMIFSYKRGIGLEFIRRYLHLNEISFLVSYQNDGPKEALLWYCMISLQSTGVVIDSLEILSKIVPKYNQKPDELVCNLNEIKRDNNFENLGHTNILYGSYYRPLLREFLQESYKYSRIFFFSSLNEKGYIPDNVYFKGSYEVDALEVGKDITTNIAHRNVHSFTDQVFPFNRYSIVLLKKLRVEPILN